VQWGVATPRARILVIDDEEPIRSAVSRALTSEGLDTELAADGTEGLRRILAESYDLIILDLLMPDPDGRTLLRQVMLDRPGQAVLVLSCLDDVRTKVDCLDLGARDYLTKPFSLAELLARVRNQLRIDGFDRVIRVGSLKLHIGRMEADAGHGPMRLKELMEHAGQPVSKSQLLASVWGYNFQPDSNIVGVCVRRLRSKFGDHLINTVRGEGYLLANG
jgi:DNA-binding response OmpR family regulator